MENPKLCSLIFLANTSIWFKGEFPSLLQHPNPNCSLIETLPLYPSNYVLDLFSLFLHFLLVKLVLYKSTCFIVE
jgi:hypothetical protein